jgi:predicted ATPase/DNA-binding XRE family transcriptional regulator
VSEFGELLRKHRLEARLSQEQLASLAAVSVKAVSSLERGERRRPYQSTVTALAAALGLAAEQIEKFKASAGRRTALPPPGTVRTDPRESSLPQYPTSFVGRTKEIVDILMLLQEHRAVTITGPGGVGKTRLAVEAGALVADRWNGGICFVDVGAVRDGRLIAAKMASLVGATLSGGDPVRHLTAQLRTQQVLLLLDNCEHVLDEIASIGRRVILECPGVSILSTSRERLGFGTEAVYRLGSLPVPDERVPFAAGRSYAATELFVDRALAADRKFVLTEELYRAVVDICRRLDGIPLAIELAAARLPALGLIELRDQLSRHLGVLSSVNRDVPDRHRTMLSTISWSYAILEPHEQMLLRRLAVFAGGFTLEAVESVCADEAIRAGEIVSLLPSLVEKSLVVLESDGAYARYRLLESTRAFASDEFAHSAEATSVSRRHAWWVAAIADRAEATYLRMSRREWMSRFEPWLDNARAALKWALAPGGDALAAARIVGGLRGMWRTAGLSLECRRWAESVLERIDAVASPVVTARVFRALAQCSDGRGRVLAAERAEALLHGTEDEVGLASSLVLRAQGLTQIGKYEDALPVVERATELFEKNGLGRSLFNARAIYDRCTVLRKLGRMHEVPALLSEARAIARAIGDEWIVLDVELARSDVEFEANNIETALAVATSALVEARTLRWDGFEISLLNSVAAYQVALRRYDDAAAGSLRALVLARGREPLGFYLALQHLAAVLAVRGFTMEAAKLCGFVDARLERESYERTRAQSVTRLLLEDVLTSTFEANLLSTYRGVGSGMTDDEAFATVPQPQDVPAMAAAQ